MMTQPELATPRLTVRPFVPADAANVQLLAGDRHVADTTLTIPHPYQDGMAGKWISMHATLLEQNKELIYAVTLASSAQLIGAISLELVPMHDRGTLGYWVGRPWWNRGYATEAARALIRHAFHNLGLQRIDARHFSRNPASGRVMQKIGMRHEGRSAQTVKKGDRNEDTEQYGIVRSDCLTITCPEPIPTNG